MKSSGFLVVLILAWL